MSNILATNPRLEDLIRKAANKLGTNHGMASDNHGMVIDNQGNSTRYIGSNGQHPSQLNKPKSSTTFGWHKTLNETLDVDEQCGEMEEGCGDTHEGELREDKVCILGKCRWERIGKAIEDGIDEIGNWLDDVTGGGMIRPDAGGGAFIDDFMYEPDTTKPDGGKKIYDKRERREATASGGASGSYVAPLEFDETEEIMESIIRDEVSKLMLESQVKNVVKRTINEIDLFDSMTQEQLDDCCGEEIGLGMDELEDSCCNNGGNAYGMVTGGCSGDGDCPGAQRCIGGDCEITTRSQYDGDRIRHGKGSGFKTPQGASDRLERFRRMNEQEELNEIPTCYSWCHGHGGTCETKYGPCNIPGGASFDSVADIPKGGVKGDGQDIRHGKKNRIRRSWDRMWKHREKNDELNEAEVPGISITKKTLKNAKSQNNKYLKAVDKKIKDYLNFKGNSNPEFPHQNNSKTDYKSPMYRNSKEDTEFIDDFRGMGLQDANGADTLDRIDDYLNGSTRTGNSQDAANVVPSTLGKKMMKTIKRKKDKIAKQKSKMTNLRGMTPDVQTVQNLKESKEEVGKIKHLIGYKLKGQ